MTNYCIQCGTKLKETNKGRFYCMNCGMLDENQHLNDTISYDSDENQDKYSGYIG